MNKFAKSLLGAVSAFSFLFAGAACSASTEEKVEEVKDDVETNVDNAAEDVKDDVEGAENDVKDGTEELVDDVADHVSTDTTVSIIEENDGSILLESLRNKDSLVDALEMLSEDGKLTFTTEDVDGSLVITSINDIYAEDGTSWVVYTSVNEYDGLAVTDEANFVEYDGHTLSKAVVGVNEVPFVRENFYKIVLE